MDDNTFSRVTEVQANLVPQNQGKTPSLLSLIYRYCTVSSNMATIYDIKIQFNEKGVDERNLYVDSTEKIGGFF